MKFVVGTKQFDSYEEAKKYEASLQCDKAKNEERIKEIDAEIELIKEEYRKHAKIMEGLRERVFTLTAERNNLVRPNANMDWHKGFCVVTKLK